MRCSKGGLFTLFLLLLSSFWSGVAVGQTASDDSDPIATQLAELTEGKEKIQSYVIEFKEAFKPDSKQYPLAQQKYIEARSKYIAWSTTVANAIERGRAKELNNEQFKKLSANAGTAGEQFVSYVQQQTAVSKNILPFLSSLFDIGFGIWNKVADRIDKKRQEYAKAFKDSTDWKQWDELGVTKTGASRENTGAPAKATTSNDTGGKDTSSLGKDPNGAAKDSGNSSADNKSAGSSVSTSGVEKNPGAVHASSSPDGAELFVDGKFVGNTPATLKIPPGDHSVRASLNGYKESARKISVESGSDVHLNFVLEKAK